MRKLRIISFKNCIELSQIGGTHTIVRRLLGGQNFDAENSELLIYGLSENSSEVIQGVPHFYFRTLRDLVSYMAKEKSSRQDWCALIFYLKPKDRLYFLVYRFISRRNIEYFKYVTEYPESTFKRYFALIDSLILRYNGGYLCVSRRLSRLYGRFFSNAHVLPPPVSDKYFSQAEQPIADGLGNTKTISFFGRSSLGKGTDVVERLFESLQKKYPECYFHIGSYRANENILSEAHTLVNGKAELSGAEWSEQGEKGYINSLLGTDIVVLPYRLLSSTIDTPLVLLEAIACNKVVLTTDVGDLRYLRAPKLFVFSDLVELSRGLESILDGSEPNNSVNRDISGGDCIEDFHIDQVSNLLEEVVSI